MLFTCCCGPTTPHDWSRIRLIAAHQGLLGFAPGCTGRKLGPDTFPSLYLVEHTYTELYPYLGYGTDTFESWTTVSKWAQSNAITSTFSRSPDYIAHSQALGSTTDRTPTCVGQRREVYGYRNATGPGGPNVRFGFVAYEQPWTPAACIDEMRAALLSLPASAFPPQVNGSVDYTMSIDGLPIPQSSGFQTPNTGALTLYHEFTASVPGSGVGAGFGNATMVLQRFLHRAPSDWCLYETAVRLGLQYTPEGPAVCTPHIATIPMILEPPSSVIWSPTAHGRGYYRRALPPGQAIVEFDPDLSPPCCS